SVIWQKHPKFWKPSKPCSQQPGNRFQRSSPRLQPEFWKPSERGADNSLRRSQRWERNWRRPLSKSARTSSMVWSLESEAVSHLSPRPPPTWLVQRLAPPKLPLYHRPRLVRRLKLVKIT